MLTVDKVINHVGRDKIAKTFQLTQNRYIGSAVEKYIREKLSVAHYLNLHQSKNKKLLDIGTGVGWFPYICKLYNHTCLGTDIENRKDYDPVYKLLDIKIKEVLVYSQQKIDINDKFDYIVSLRSFIGSRPTAFNLEDWKFFLTNMNEHILDNGGLYLGCNSIDTRGEFKRLAQHEKSHWGDKKLKDIFGNFIVEPSKKTKIKPNTIYIPKENLQEVINQL